MIHQKKTVLLLCWCAYVSAYLCRVNMSTALVKLERAFSSDSGTLGLIGGLFFITYAVGQLINGFIGDRVSPHRMLLAALAGTAALNLLVALSDSLTMIAVCWALNGYVQAMFWGPLMRVLSQYYDKSENAMVSMVMSTSMVAGYILAWVGLGGLLSDARWNAFFLIPAVASAALLPVWGAFAHRQHALPVAESPPHDRRKTLRVLKESHLAFVAGICVCMGLIKESLTLWMPTIMIKALGYDSSSSYLFLLIVPVSNFFGILLARRLSSVFAERIGSGLLILFGGMAAGGAGLLLLGGASGFLGLLMLSLISAMTFGANSILLSFIPLSFARHNLVSTLVGIFDFCAYTGAAVSAYMLGRILSGDAWRSIPIFWLIVSAAAVGLIAAYMRMSSRASEA